MHKEYIKFQVEFCDELLPTVCSHRLLLAKVRIPLPEPARPPAARACEQGNAPARGFLSGLARDAGLSCSLLHSQLCGWLSF